RFASTGAFTSTLPQFVLPDPRTLYPLPGGARWVYRRGTRGRYTETVLTTPGHMGRTLTTVVRNSERIDEHYVASASGAWDFGADDQAAGERVMAKPPLVLLLANDTMGPFQSSNGTLHGFKGKRRTAIASFTFLRRAVRYENVTVPAGTFRALRLDRTL